MYSSHGELIEQSKFAGRPTPDLIEEIQAAYLADKRPWIIGFSGGKDSTTVLSLVYHAISTLDTCEPLKPLYVVSSDTLVETPVVVNQIASVLDDVESAAVNANLPISCHPVHPEKNQTFWVNLLGRGYPAPTTSFRWCTERMKIDPVSQFITERIAEFGEAIIVLGSRKEESSTRAQVIAKHRISSSVLGRHSSLPNAYTYMPIEDWSADEVWEYLLSADTPWGKSNKPLFNLYKGSNQGECPLVIDTSTPSCGNSRFGCWTCTVVTKDKAIHGLIESGETWMQPLLDFRDELYESTDPAKKSTYRNYKRRTGKVTFVAGKEINDDGKAKAKHIPGPYWLATRQQWLKKLLKIEKLLRDSGRNLTLIGRDELHAIRQQWLRDPNEPDWKDSLPGIFAEVYPEENIEWVVNDAGVFTQHDSELLDELAEQYQAPSDLIRKLIEMELEASGLGRRRGIQQTIQSLMQRDWESFEDASARKQKTVASDSWKEELHLLNEQLNAAPR